MASMTRRSQGLKPDSLAKALIQIEVLEVRSKGQDRKIESQEKKIKLLEVELANKQAEMVILQNQLYQTNEELKRISVIVESNQESVKAISMKVSRNEESLLLLSEKVPGEAQNAKVSKKVNLQPVFSGKSYESPKKFLEELQKYFTVNLILSDAEKLRVINDCLKFDAGDWFSKATAMYRINNYDHFKQLFLVEYWSERIQSSVWRKCHAVDKIPEHISYVKHFTTWYHELKYLDFPRLTVPEIINSIAYHYPVNIKRLMFKIPDKTESAVIQLLKKEEETRRDAVQEDEKKDEASTSSNESSVKQFVDK